MDFVRDTTRSEFSILETKCDKTIYKRLTVENMALALNGEFFKIFFRNCVSNFDFDLWL